MHKKCWSVKNTATGRVILHCNEFEVRNAIFKVSEAGRQRVLREKRKNVHAGIFGEFISAVAVERDNKVKITYNPYKTDKFYTDDLLQEKVQSAEVVYATGRTVYAVKNLSNFVGLCLHT